MNRIENCSLYLPTAKLHKASLPPGGKGNGSLLKRASQFTFDCGDGPVQMNVMEAGAMDAHLQGFRGYVSTLENVPADLAKADEMIAATRLVLGIILNQPIDSASDTFAALNRICEAHGGFLFVADSILTADGFLVGPASYPKAVMEPLATVDIGEVEHEGPPPTDEQLAGRAASLTILKEKGFVCAGSLPLPAPLAAARMRPATEIAARLGAAALAFLYCSAPEDYATTEGIQALAAGDELRPALTPREREILSLPRDEAREEHSETIGWTLENMWGLAWALAFEHELEIDSGQIDDAPITDLSEWMPTHDQSMADVLARATPRTLEEVASREDLFYCAHNAVRSAQLGRPTVPSGFDPRADGGAVHERRHALTWCLSPGVPWDDTDLST